MTRWRAKLGTAVASGRGVAPQLFDALVIGQSRPSLQSVWHD